MFDLVPVATLHLNSLENSQQAHSWLLSALTDAIIYSNQKPAAQLQKQ